MKTPQTHFIQCLAILLLATSPCETSQAQATNADSGPAPGAGFYIGQSSFPDGDLIEITSVERSPDQIVVKGHYNLVSADRAQLAFYITTTSRIAVPTARTQVMAISRGQGDFELTDPNLAAGMPHVTMYSVPGGDGFAGIYFGTKEEAAEESGLDLGYNRKEVPASGANQALFKYLGNPVEPPANMDAKYTKEGLKNAIQQAASAAGVAVKKIAIDDSEYPFLIGVICGGSDYAKLKAAIKKIDGYEYGGSVGNDSNSDGSDTCNTFNLVPYQAQPAALRQQIEHRLMLRQQVFYAMLSAQE